MKQQVLEFVKKVFNGLKIRSKSQLKDFLFHYTFVAIILKSILSISLVVNASFKISSAGSITKFLPGLIIYMCFALIALSFCLLLKGRKHMWYLAIFNLVFSIILIFDIWHFRGFGAFLSMHQLSELVNLDNLGDSILSMARPLDIFVIFDSLVIFIGAFFIKKPYKNTKRNIPYFLIFITVPVLTLTYAHYKLDIQKTGPQFLFKTCWTPAQTITDLSPIGYHIYDVYTYFKDSRTVSLNTSSRQELENWFNDKKENLPDNKYKGIFKGKNLLILQVESLENFVIGKSIDGQEITPNLNKLLGNSIYIPNIYEQVNLGTSSDADLMTNTSVYPVRRGSTFFRFPNNSYNSLPLMMQSKGYSTLAIHPDKGAYWNWMPALKSIGFQECIDAKRFKQDELIGLGLSDGSYFKQVEPIIAVQKQPFYTFMVTLTSHGPFDIPQKYRKLKLKEDFDTTKMGGYLQSVHYTDEQIGKFIEKLDQDHILDNTVVVVYGDHCGVHKYYQDEIEKIEPSESWWQEENKRVPLIIYQKSYQGEISPVIGGQVDIMPTVAYLMGIDENKFSNTAMGRILLKTTKNYAVLANGTFIGDAASEKEKQTAIEGLEKADEIISGNYFRVK